jgi:hypothetical protein
MASSVMFRYSESVDSVDVWPEHLEFNHRQNYLEQPNEEDQSEELSYLDQSSDLSYPEQPKDLSYLDQPQDQSYLDQPQDLSYPDQPQDQSYLDQPKDLSYLEYPAEDVKSWYMEGSDDLAGQLYAMQKEKRSSENPEGYRLTQVYKTLALTPWSNSFFLNCML